VTRAREIALVTAALLVLALVALVGARSVQLAGAEPRSTDALAQAATASGRDPTPVRASLAAIPTEDASTASVIVQGEGRSLTEPEVDQLTRFVDRGGHALVLGDRSIAQALDVPLAASPAMPVDGGREVPARATIDEEAYRLRVPDAIPVLDTRKRAPVTVATTNATFLDVDGDGRESENDAPGPHPLSQTASEGRMLFLATPNLAQPYALGDTDNRAFLEDAIDEHLPEGPLYLDRSRASDPLRAPVKASLATVPEAGSDPLRGYGLLALALTAIGAGTLHANRPDTDAAEAGLDDPREWPGGIDP